MKKRTSAFCNSRSFGWVLIGMAVAYLVGFALFSTVRSDWRPFMIAVIVANPAFLMPIIRIFSRRECGSQQPGAQA